MPPHIRKSLLVLGSITLVLVAAAGIVLAVLDSILLKEAQAQATIFAAKIGRPVLVRGVSLRLTGPTVRVSGVEIGPASGETVPLATLERLEIKPALWKALRSRGKEIEIHSAEVDRLEVNLVRFPNGETNLERLQSQFAESRPPEEKKSPTEMPSIQLDHFALKEGKIRLLDASRESSRREPSEPRELQIQHLELKVDDLRAGKPLELLVKAAILADQQNFELRLSTAPLPATLIPTVTRLVLKVQPIDLKPLGPYLPRSVGLQEGRIDADFHADLGAAVPGGKGRTTMEGGIHALGLRFAGAEGAKPLDVALETAAQGDASRGDLSIDRLQLDFGPARISGKGRASGLRGDQPRVEGLEILGHDLDLARVAALCPPLARELKGRIAGPIELAIRGSGSQAAQSLEVKLDLGAVRLALPKNLSKAAGAPMSLVAHLGGSGGGKLRFDAQADLTGADLRPGESLNKPPGEPLKIAVSGAKTGAGTPRSPTKIQIADLNAQIRDSAVKGSGSLELGVAGQQATKTFDLVLESPHLDLDKLLLPSPPDKPPLDPALFAGVRGHALVKVGSLRKSRMDLSNVVAEATLVEDELSFKTLSAEAWGGNATANGTKLRLAHPQAPFTVIAHLQGVDVARGQQLLSDRKLFSGTFSGDVNLSGLGSTEELLRTLSGNLQGKLLDGQFLGKDLLASITAPLARALPFSVPVPKEGGVTNLGKELGLAIGLEKGFARLKSPIQINRPEANLTFSGGARLNGALDLAGTAALSPETISALTQGKVRVSQPVPIAFKLTGPLWKPVVSDIDLKGAVESIVKQAAAGALTGLLGKAGASTTAAALRERANSEEQAVKEKAQQEQQRAEEAGRNAAEKAGKQVEDEAAKRLKGLLGR